jgi:hypothetical protein
MHVICDNTLHIKRLKNISNTNLRTIKNKLGMYTKWYEKLN